MFCVIAVTALTVFYEPLPIAKSLMVALTTGIYVGMIGLTVGNLTRSSLAAYGAGFAFIFMEMAFSGRLTAPLYLLVLSSQIDLNLSPVWQHLDLWIWAKAGSTLISFFLFAVNGWLLDVGPRRRR
ncbi:MAG TPA: hypothetical protein PKD55_19155 [Bellilinea sp.]|nr:hypothetical protein [Bellilinea sp.]